MQAYGVTTSVAIYAVLDITAKVLFGIFSFSNTQAKTTAEFNERSVPDHDLRPDPHVHHEVHALGRNERDPRFSEVERAEGLTGHSPRDSHGLAGDRRA